MCLLPYKSRLNPVSLDISFYIVLLTILLVVLLIILLLFPLVLILLIVLLLFSTILIIVHVPYLLEYSDNSVIAVYPAFQDLSLG